MTSIVLPSNVIRLISEYSKPVTRADWRKLHKMKNYDLFKSINIAITQNKMNNKLAYIVRNNMKNSVWWHMYDYIETWGLRNATRYFNLSKEEIIRIDGMVYAIIYNQHHGT